MAGPTRPDEPVMRTVVSPSRIAALPLPRRNVVTVDAIAEVGEPRGILRSYSVLQPRTWSVVTVKKSL